MYGSLRNAFHLCITHTVFILICLLGIVCKLLVCLFCRQNQSIILIELYFACESKTQRLTYLWRNGIRLIMQINTRTLSALALIPPKPCNPVSVFRFLHLAPLKTALLFMTSATTRPLTYFCRVFISIRVWICWSKGVPLWVAHPCSLHIHLYIYSRTSFLSLSIDLCAVSNPVYTYLLRPCKHHGSCLGFTWHWIIHSYDSTSRQGHGQ